MSVVRHDWYQTEERVVIDVLVKNANNRNCSVDIQSNHVSVRGDDLHLDLDLSHEIDTSKSSFRIASVKIEIVLQKIIGERWLSLTKTSDASSSVTVKTIPQPAQPIEQQSVSSSSSSKKDKNWDRVVKDVCEQEDIEKDEAKQLNSLFEKIYSESDPEVRRAMNKSFTESGGTVLSTNWNEVSAKKVQMKPPTGTEFRSWSE